MHELATTRNIVSLCEEQATRHGFRRVLEIRLKVGELSGIVPACLEEFFPYASKGTVCEGAVLRCESVKAAVRCPDCGYEGETAGWDCPRCGGSGIRLTRGREFFVEDISVE